MQIAIDTSTETASLALVQDGNILAELTWHSGQNHTTQLLPHLSHLLKQAKLSIREADCIIVARGPGSYNGLRVGISTAKGLAFSLGIPIIGVSTLEAEAYQHADLDLPVCPVFNAGRGEIATAIYQKKGDSWSQLAGEHITTVDALCSQIDAKTIFCGEFLPTIAEQLSKQVGSNAIIVSPAAGLRRAGFLAELGLKRFEAGDYDDVVTLQPTYLRGPAITQAKHR
ncbi:MAG: tRNA (adenosine(37)-N6)-threonylcarbamoyltransferase complex dimerization subunit type 1 TsaB [Chloroflexi bacterium]|nr:tRNA (adenosine(37)-N6)-threonylcarbamoyltransferase complex dimerization subunit type 1 TsaB [Chloroflexota bacterium]